MEQQQLGDCIQAARRAGPGRSTSCAVGRHQNLTIRTRLAFSRTHCRHVPARREAAAIGDCHPHLDPGSMRPRPGMNVRRSLSFQRRGDGRCAGAAAGPRVDWRDLVGRADVLPDGTRVAAAVNSYRRHAAFRQVMSAWLPRSEHLAADRAQRHCFATVALRVERSQHRFQAGPFAACLDAGPARLGTGLGMRIAGCCHRACRHTSCRVGLKRISFTSTSSGWLIA